MIFSLSIRKTWTCRHLIRPFELLVTTHTNLPLRRNNSTPTIHSRSNFHSRTSILELNSDNSDLQVHSVLSLSDSNFFSFSVVFYQFCFFLIYCCCLLTVYVKDFEELEEPEELEELVSYL